MNKVKKIFVLMLIVAVVSLGLTGCKDKSEHPSGDHPAKETASVEKAASEHPSDGNSTSEHPSDGNSTNEHPSTEHPE